MLGWLLELSRDVVPPLAELLSVKEKGKSEASRNGSWCKSHAAPLMTHTDLP